LERPDDAVDKELREYTGLSGFSMTVTRQGVKFASQDKPKAVAFVDVGRVIKVYEQSDSSLLAALQLAQNKWGGVQVNGTDEYKRRCAEIAAKNCIRVANPELEGIRQEMLEKTSRENSMSVYALARELAKKILGKPVPIVTDARDGKEYSGLLLGVIEKEGHYYAAQCLLGEHVILHGVVREDVPALKALIGQEVELTSDNARVRNVVDNWRTG
jgi:hypothetical protein